MGKWIRRLGAARGALAVAAAALFGYAWYAADAALARIYTVADAPLVFAGDDAEAARGAHLFTVLGCVECHGTAGTGRQVFDAGPVGRMVAPNLTPAAIAVASWSAS